MPTFVLPLASFRLTSPFGERTHPVTGEERKFHNGLDLAAPTGTPVLAVGAGTVTTGSVSPINGNWIKIDHGDGYSSAYLHLSATSVAVGQKVGIGQVIGKVGATGRATGPHLHFILYKGGVPVDPAPFILGGAAAGVVSAAASAFTGWGRFAAWGLVTMFAGWFVWKRWGSQKQLPGPKP